MQFRFEAPVFLWALIPVFILALYVLMLKRKKRTSISLFQYIFLQFTLVLCIVGLARPQGGTQMTSSVGRTSNIFIALDISRSMLAQDTLPSRILFATSYLQRLLPQLSGARFALFPFTLDGYLQVPLTGDALAVSDLLASLSPSIITLQGTDLTQSLNTLYTRILESEERTRARGADWSGAQVLLVSDGENHAELDKGVLAKFRKSHIPVFSLLTGTTQGGFIPKDTKQIAGRDPSAGPVISHADPKTLKDISENTGGKSFGSSFDTLSSLSHHLQRAMQFGKLTTVFRVDREFFPYFFLAGFFSLFFSFIGGRWEYAIRTILIFILFHTQTVVGADEKEAIEKYNQAIKLVEKKDLKTAIELFQDAAYASDNKELQKKALYSLGNAYLKAGDPAQALQVYQQAFDTLTGNRTFDQEANQRISDNMVLAAKVEDQQKQEAKKNQKGQGEKEGEQKGEPEDQKGPKDYRAQEMDEGMKKKFFDTVSNEERQGIQRTMERRNKGITQTSSKPW